MQENKADETHTQNQNNGDKSGDVEDAPEKRENAGDKQGQGRAKRKVSFVTKAKQSWSHTLGWNKAMVLFTAVIAVANICYVHYARKQFSVMNRQLGQMVLQYPELKKSANAAKSSAEAAKNANLELQAIQRPFLGFDGIAPSQHGTTTVNGQTYETLTYTAQWKNSGNTPATGASWFWMKQIKGEPSEKEFTGDPSKTNVDVFQPQVTRYEGQIVWTKGSLNNWLNTKQQTEKQFIGWGWVAYRDEFPDSDPHVTEFCVRFWDAAFRDSLNPQFLGGEPINWLTCKQHNCMDKQCKDYEAISKFAPKNP